jgi:hypothetical protein
MKRIDGREFYHVCEGCNAKFFSPRVVKQCPRCGNGCRPHERLVPPWRKVIGPPPSDDAADQAAAAPETGVE